MYLIAGERERERKKEIEKERERERTHEREREGERERESERERERERRREWRSVLWEVCRVILHRHRHRQTSGDPVSRQGPHTIPASELALQCNFKRCL